MRKIQRLVAVGAMAALTAALGACSSAEEPASGTATTTAKAPTSAPAAASNGITEISDIKGPACGQGPPSGEGSAQGMVDDPVGTAASNNPLLTTLVSAASAAKLVDTLNNADALTVFAPINPAFEKLPAGTVDSLVSAPNVGTPEGDLSKILTTHVVSTRYDAEGLASAKTVKSLQSGSMLTIGGTAPDKLTVSSGGVTANVVCANVPTANATVFLIDSVMMPAS